MECRTCKTGELICRLTLPYPRLSGNNANRQGLGRTYKSDAAKAYELDVKRIVVLSRYAALCVREAIDVRYDAWPPDDRERDSDNVEKPLKDALTKAGLWISDSNRVILDSRFVWHPKDVRDAKEGCVIVTITRHAPASREVSQ